TTPDAPRICELASRRRDEAARLRTTEPLPSELAPSDIEAVSAGTTLSAQRHGDSIRGMRVSGSRMVQARPRGASETAAERGELITDFQDGDIVVAPMINPNWLPYFSRAGGFVSGVGGWLSHTAILAREHDVPMIVGADGLSSIAEGSLLRLHLDGHIEV